MEAHDRQDCEVTIRRIHELLSSGIFNHENKRALLQQSAFIDLMICMRDLMSKSEKYAKRIDFTDDVMTNAYVKDVTDAITAVRDACCHINSFKKVFDERRGRAAYVVIYGKQTAMNLNGLELKSDYEDDTAIFYGANRLYLGRHIMRAFGEAKSQLAQFLTPEKSSIIIPRR